MSIIADLDCIMLVDDDEATNFLHRSVIRRENLGVHVKVITNGQEALDYLTGSEQYYPGTDLPQPGIIFLDLNMPGMNGWEFLDQYRKLPTPIRQQIALMVLTTSLNPDDEARARQIPEVDGFLQKPLTGPKLQGIINQYFYN